MADEETKEEKPKKSGGGKGLIIGLVVVIVILLLSVIGGGFFLYSSGVFSDAPQATMSKDGEEKADAGDDSKEFFKVPINDLVLNITNSKGREKLMKLSFSLKSTEPTIEAIVEAYKAEIIDVVIQQISARSSEELLTVGGKELLKEELVEEINMVINEATATNEDIKKNNIKKLYFTTFVIK